MKTLYYIHDPMCSWCWGFSKTWSEVEQALSANVEIQYIAGGLAPDSDQPMPDEMQTMLQNTWGNIQKKIPGTQFNFDFWENCKPRRSTYPACRAVLAAKNQQAEKDMIQAIQHAYYLNAKNPSDDLTLLSLAKELRLDVRMFERDLHSPAIQSKLRKQIEFGRSIGAQGFPSLVLHIAEQTSRINIDYNSANNIVKQIL